MTEPHIREIVKDYVEQLQMRIMKYIIEQHIIAEDEIDKLFTDANGAA